MIGVKRQNLRVNRNGKSRARRATGISLCACLRCALLSNWRRRLAQGRKVTSSNFDFDGGFFAGFISVVEV